MVKNDCGLKLKPVTTENPQANAIVKHVHQTIGNIIRILKVQAMDSNDPWTGTLAAAARATHHTPHFKPGQCNWCSAEMQSSMSNTHRTAGNTSDEEDNLELMRMTDATICLNAFMTAPLEAKQHL
jgi:ethanolamine ammonia-lyase small subunit